MGKASRQHRRIRRRRQRRSWWLGAGVVIVALAVTGIVASQRTTVDGPPDFKMVAYQGEDVLGGNEVAFSDLLGRDKPVVLNFWAGLCPPCRREMPGFQRVYDNLGDQFILVGVDVGPFVGLGSHADAQRFLRDYAIRYPTAYAKSATPVRDYGILGMPTTFFFSADGDIVSKHTGYLPEAQLRRELQRLLTANE